MHTLQPHKPTKHKPLAQPRSRHMVLPLQPRSRHTVLPLKPHKPLKATIKPRKPRTKPNSWCPEPPTILHVRA